MKSDFLEFWLFNFYEILAVAQGRFKFYSSKKSKLSEYQNWHYSSFLHPANSPSLVDVARDHDHAGDDHGIEDKDHDQETEEDHLNESDDLSE